MNALAALAPDLPRMMTLFALLFARMGAMLMLLPGFSDDAVPGRMRLLIALGLAAGMQLGLRQGRLVSRPQPARAPVSAPPSPLPAPRATPPAPAPARSG